MSELEQDIYVYIDTCRLSCNLLFTVPFEAKYVVHVYFHLHKAIF